MKTKSYIDIEKINRKLRTLGTGKYLKFQEGNNKIRVLPRLDDSGIFWVDLTQHYGFKDDERGRAYACLRAMKEKPCPICEFVKAIEEEDAEANKKLINDLRSKTAHLINVVDRSDNSIKILSANQKLLRGLLNYVTDEDYGEEVLDPENGFDFTITKTGAGLGTRYSDPRISPKERPIGIEGWEEKLHNLEGEVEVLPYAKLVQELESNYGDYIEELGLKFKGGTSEEKPKSGKGRKAVRATEEEDLEEDVDAIAEDDEEDAPAPKGKKKQIKEEEDDDDFLDEEEEIEEEEPVKKRGRK